MRGVCTVWWCFLGASLVHEEKKKFDVIDKTIRFGFAGWVDPVDTVCTCADTQYIDYTPRHLPGPTAPTYGKLNPPFPFPSI